MLTEYRLRPRTIDTDALGLEISPSLGAVASALVVESLTVPPSPLEPPAFRRALVLRENDPTTLLMARPNPEVVTPGVSVGTQALLAAAAIERIGIGALFLDDPTVLPEGDFTNNQLGELFSELRGKLQKYVQRKTGSDFMEAEDAVQEAFYQAIRARHRLGELPSSSWFYTTAFRQVVGQWRKWDMRRGPEIEDDMLTDIQSDPAGLEYLALRGVIQQGIDTLPPRQRKVAELAMQGVNPPEIAQMLGTEANTVRQHLVHVRKKLAVHLAASDIADTIDVSIITSQSSTKLAWRSARP